jgi:hypothetical protein
MNNIHPGEPEGTDASMLLVKDIIKDPKKTREILKNIDLNIICQYNVDGTVNQSCCARANQNGPDILGFRGNAKNLDLNRDFIKCDSKNARAFVRYFSQNKFHILIDNHTSNGADYQYTLTWFHTRAEKLHPDLVPIMNNLSASLSQCLLNCKVPNSPYVNTLKQIPDSGIVAFWETGRFSTGYAALMHSIGFTVETHMWKPFEDRVAVNLAFMENLLNLVGDDVTSKALYQAHKNIVNQERLTGTRTEIIDWKLNESKFENIEFLGYEASYQKSEISGLDRLYYDRNKSFKKMIPYYNAYVPADSIKLPRMYVIPQAWDEIIQRLTWNGIPLRRMGKDTLMYLRTSYIQGFETTKRPYEGHYMHFNTSVKDTLIPIQIYRGDYYLITGNNNRAFLASTLEPQSPDSYFNWNFFDGILMQKEGFSDYVFEEKALEILNGNKALKANFEKEKMADPQFASNHMAQLNWIYYRSEFYEKSHNRYPIYRMD